MKQLDEVMAEKMMEIAHWALSKVVKPDITVQNVGQLDEQEIDRIKREYGIEAIILDVDDTLRVDMKNISKTNQEWIEKVKENVKVIILSNGIDRRMEEYFAERGIDYIGFAHKPFKKNFVKACQKMSVKPENVMVVGDSLFDDVYGGKRNKMKTALVKSVDEGR